MESAIELLVGLCGKRHATPPCPRGPVRSHTPFSGVDGSLSIEFRRSSSSGRSRLPWCFTSGASLTPVMWLGNRSSCVNPVIPTSTHSSSDRDQNSPPEFFTSPPGADTSLIGLPLPVSHPSFSQTAAPPSLPAVSRCRVRPRRLLAQGGRSSPPRDPMADGSTRTRTASRFGG
jgi:hypothetical protein